MGKLERDLAILMDQLPEPKRHSPVTIERMCIRKLEWVYDPDWPHVWQATAFLGRNLVVRSNPNNEAAPYEFRVGTILRAFKSLEGAQQAAQEHFENIILEQLEAPQ